MNFIADVSPQIKAVELKVDPIIIRVNKFDEESAKEFVDAMSRAQNTGQSVIPVVIDSYGGQGLCRTQSLSEGNAARASNNRQAARYTACVSVDYLSKAHGAIG